MRRGLVVAVVAVTLSGCALPVPVQIASWVLDGVSFVVTEKSVADHGISMIANKDCALWRGLKGDAVCSEIDDPGVFAVAAATTATVGPPDTEPDAETLADFETAAGPPEVAPLEVAAAEPQNGERLMIAGKRVWSERPEADLYFVIGSFSSRDNARRMVDRHRDLGPAVMASRLDGAEVYRVAVGPFAAAQKRAMRLAVKQSGIGDAWAIRVDHGDWRMAGPGELADPAEAIAASPAVTDPAPARTESEEIAETPVSAPAVPDLSSELIDGRGRNLVIGSFSIMDNARKLAADRAALSPRIVAVEVAGGWRYRVVIGPYGKAESLDRQRRLADTGIDHVWAMDVEPEAAVSDDESNWGVDLVKYIIDMFGSPDTTDVVAIISPLEV